MEIELKLQLAEKDAYRVFQAPCLREDYAVHHVFSVYYDTPDQLLSQHGYALRLRQNDDCLIQTLKTAGVVTSGLHKREEWEREVSGPHLDYDMLQQKLNGLFYQVAGYLTEVFHTEFIRHLWLFKEADSEVEVVFDHGVILSAQQRLPICEIELELKKGNESVLHTLSQRLQAELPVTPYDESKAHRGYRLYRRQRL